MPCLGFGPRMPKAASYHVCICLSDKAFAPGYRRRSNNQRDLDVDGSRYVLRAERGLNLFIVSCLPGGCCAQLPSPADIKRKKNGTRLAQYAVEV